MVYKRGFIGLLLITVLSGMPFVCAHAASPTLSTVHIESSNFHSSWTKVGDTVTLTFTASEDVQSVSVTIAGHSVVAPQLSGGPQSWTATYMMGDGDEEGIVPFTIDFANLANEWGTQVTSTTDGTSVTFDKTPPSVPSTPDLTALSDTGMSDSDNVTSAIWPMFQGTAGADAFEILLYKDGVWETTELVSDGTWLVGMNAALVDGTYSMTAKAVDAAGNMSEFSGAISVTVDTTAPQGTGMDLADGSDTGQSNTDGITRGENPEFGGIASDPVVGGVASGIWKVEVWSDDSKLGTDADGTYYSVVLPTLEEGARTVSGRVYDVAGNMYDLSNLPILIDRTPPMGSMPDLAAGSDTGDSNTDDITQGNTPQFTGTASDPWEAGVSSGVWKVEVSSDDETVATDSVDPFYDVTLADLPEGSRTVSATVYDVAGNTCAAGSLAVTVDRTAPTVPSTPDLTAASDIGMSDSDNITKQTRPMFEGTAAADSTQVLLFKDGGWERTESMSGGTWLVGVNTALSDGIYTFTARVLDAAGNMSDLSSAISVTIDTVLPAGTTPDLADASDTGRSNTDNLTQGINPQFTGLASDADSGVWKVEASSDDGKTATDTSSPYYSITLATLGEGLRSVSATVYDVAGNTYAAGSLSLLVDHTPPTGTTPDLAVASDTGSSNADNITQGINPQFTGTADDANDVWKVELSSDDGKSAADESSPFYDITLATLNEGNRSVTATMHDVAGNTYDTAGLPVTVDRTAPVVQSIVCADSNPTNALSVDFTVTFSEDVTNVDAGDFSIDASGVTGASITSVSGSDATRTVTVNTGSGNGTLSIDLIDDDSIIDIAGNPLGGSGTGNGNYTNGESYTIDKADPVSSVSSGPSDPSNVANPSFTFSASDTGGSGVAKMECWLTGTATRDWAQCASDGGPVTNDLSGLFAGYTLPTDGSVDGSVTLGVKATDAAGNIESTATWTWKYDSTPPDAPSFTGIADDKGSSNTDEKTNDPTLFIFGTAEANSTIEVFRDGTSIGTTLADGAGDWTFDYTGVSLGDGWYSFTATATDAAGNTSAESSPLSVLIDRQAPPPPDGPDPANNTYTNDDPLIFSWSEPTDPPVPDGEVRGYHIIIYDSTHKQVRGSYPSATNYEPASLDDGTYTWKLATRDVAGNTGAWSDEWTFVLDTEEPTISLITSSTSNGCYNVGANINVTVSFSEEVTLTGGTLDVTLDAPDVVGITAFGPATSASTTYTVDAGDNSCDLDATGITLNGGTLQDRAGNDADMMFPTTTITDGSDIVVDTTAPVINPIASAETVECDGEGNVTDLNTWLNNHGGANATDNCSGVTWTNDFTGLSDDCGETGSALVTFTATDDCGLSSTIQATFTIEDTTPPSITTPASDETVECDGAGNIAELNAWLNSHGGASVMDNCGGVTWTDDFTSLSDDCGETGSALVTFTVTDCCGLSSTTTATFTIEDTTIPVINDLAFYTDDSYTTPTNEYTVDDCCETTVYFASNVTDQCCIARENLIVDVTLPTNNAVLENIVVNRVQNGQGRVDITGSADVRCLTSCPARVEVYIEATDCCGNNAIPVTSTATEGRVYDETAPEPKDDPNGDEDRSISDNLEVRSDDYGQHRLMIRQDTPVHIDVVANDTDNCSTCTCDKHLWIDKVVAGPKHGTATIEDAESVVSDPGTSIRYAPYQGYYGDDEFTCQVIDACGNTTDAVAYIEVVAQTLIEDQFITTCADTPVSFDVNATGLWINPANPGEIPFVFSIVTSPIHGVISGDVGDVTYAVQGGVNSATITLIYTPATGFSGRDAITLQFSDPFGGSSKAVVDITVNECAGQPGSPPLIVQQEEILPLIVPLTFSSVYETAWETVTLVAVADGTAYQSALSATWKESIGKYVLRLDTASLPFGLYQMTIPLGNGETVTLMIEVGKTE